MEGVLRLQDAPATADDLARSLRVAAAMACEGDRVEVRMTARGARTIAGEIDRARRDASEVGEARAMLDRAQGAADRAAHDLRAAQRALRLGVAVLGVAAVLGAALICTGGVL